MEPKIVLMDRAYPPDSLGETGALDLRNIKEPVWETIVSTCKSASIRLYHIMLQSLEGIERLDATSSLSMEWANKVSGLSPVFRMVWLKNLFVSDFPRLANIEGIEALEHLKTLHLSGNRGSLHPPLRLVSIQPIAKLSNLQELTVANVRLEDDDITFLAALPKLRELTLSNSFDRKQFAFLAKRLNGQLDLPISANRKMNVSCPTCGQSLFYFIGKRMPSLCKGCDSKKFEKMTSQFEDLMATS
jgi:hypothetical protein